MSRLALALSLLALGLPRVAEEPAARQQAPTAVLELFAEVAKPTAPSIATLTVDDRVVALATVVDREGLLLSKASELEGSLHCTLHDGRRLEAEVVALDPNYDLALVRVAADDLVPIVWSSSSPSVGRLVVAPTATGAPIGVGVVGVAPRRVSGGRALLGVVFAPEEGGARVERVEPDTPAAIAGIQAGDQLIRIGSDDVIDYQQAARLIRLRAAGTLVGIELERAGERIVVWPVLALREGRRRRSLLDGEQSDLRAGFPSVMQHDVVLAPEQCGGPLVAVDGAALGVNIARAGRVASYAVPAGEVVVVLNALREREKERPR